MRITLIPQLRDDTLVLEKSSGDRLRINGELFNFNTLNDGDMIPAGAVPCEWIVRPVEKIDGEVRLTLLLPHGPNPEPWQAFPEAITVIDDGPIDVPVDTHVDVEWRRADGGAEEVTTIRRWQREPEQNVEFLADPEPFEERIEIEGGYEIVTMQHQLLIEEPVELSRVFVAQPEEETDDVEP